MYLTTASILSSPAWLIWACTVHRRPVRPPWTRRAAASSALVLLIVNLFAPGLDSLGVAALSPLEAFPGRSLLPGAATLAAPALAVLATPRLRRRFGGAAEAAPLREATS